MPDKDTEPNTGAELFPCPISGAPDGPAAVYAGAPFPAYNTPPYVPGIDNLVIAAYEAPEL